MKKLSLYHQVIEKDLRRLSRDITQKKASAQLKKLLEGIERTSLVPRTAEEASALREVEEMAAQMAERAAEADALKTSLERLQGEATAKEAQLAAAKAEATEAAARAKSADETAAAATAGSATGAVSKDVKKKSVKFALEPEAVIKGDEGGGGDSKRVAELEKQLEHAKKDRQEILHAAEKEIEYHR